ncbi:lysis system i-spanin subunit Rz [Paenalcaligenes suwonensis]|uniref:lysis system i-spanin subunit Rz n=1 Tax=Paenalcaligenes suwonensis TaxID=1202713 RepID=UPI0014087D7A|nr:lysis system i-spanin subunit Rz [Paenalcaligenes suwonensis]NHC63172.1 hypothetical protein [Paenalcaligenes suwonensis]
MSIRPTVITGAATALLSGLLIWQVQGWRYSSQLAEQQSAHDRVMTVLATEALNQQKQRQAAADTKQAEFSLYEAQLWGELRNAEYENDRLRVLVGNGAHGLRVNATCPATNSGRLSDTSTSTSMGNGATAELNKDARQDYYALRKGIELVTRQLLVCQEKLR